MSNISTLQQSLINAKKVMNKVDSGNFTKNETTMSSSSTPNINMESVQQHIPNAQEPLTPIPPNLQPKANMSKDKIKNSNLPEVIKKAMLNNPIPDIPFNGGGAPLTENFINNVKDQMNKQGMETNTPNTPLPTTSLPTTSLVVPPTSTITKKLSSKALKSIIKESVKELLDETIGFKKNSNENFQFRVGDRIFYGKITSSKSVK